MKLAIPVDHDNMETAVSSTFGRAPYFLIFDSNTKESIFIANSATTHSGGAGIKAAQTIVDNKATALATPQCGENAAQVLQAAGITLYKTTSTSIKETIQAFESQTLPILQEIHAGHHGHGKQ